MSSSTPARSGLELAKSYPTRSSGLYWIQSEKMPNPLQMYVDMTEEGGGYDFYPITTGPTIQYPGSTHGGTPLGLDLVYPRSKFHWRAMSNFVGAFMVNRNAFVFNNIVQSQLTSGSNFSINTDTGSNVTRQTYSSTWGGTEAKISVENQNGTRNVNVVTDTMTVTGSLNVTGSVSIANAGDLTMYGHKMFNVGAFLSTQTQSGSANVSQSINYNTTDYSQGVSVVSGTRLTVANAGVYNIQFSAQVDRVSGSGTDTVHIWLKKNGTNVTNSAGAITIAGGAAAAKTISSWNYVVDAAASDYYEICWQTTDANIQLINAAASGNIPDVPSVIVTVTQVR
jgi:hypothetical protein